ncbi:TonB-dependent siderophore receptor [Methylocella silvestris]|uniref:TonB-dependent siderophore receptor n=1 Tax=Methylocella silvestris TaxID=199596 RepID=A0A2J7TLC6_METSI|nr:TonB-dependent siderophore receptor [Methylocella silvestris]PNG27576.1 TonB-dependent siderophore receptor [Methylocella silvestris]
MSHALRMLCAASATFASIPSASYAQSDTLPTVIVQPAETGADSQNVAGPPVEQTTAGPVQGYRALTAESATRTNTPINEIPQSIQVIPRSLIDDQDSLSVTEALRNVSGVVGTNVLQTPAFNSTYIRGFPADHWVDGLTTFYNGGDRDSLVNVERIEVLKGPNAILYGGGAGAPLGGVVNLVSKLPTDKAFAEMGMSFGSFTFLQPYFDINTPITQDGTVLFRITGEYTSANSFIDVIETNRYSFNPTLTFTNKSDTTLTLQGRVTSWEQQEYQGLPATGTVTGPFRLNPDLFAGPSDIPKSYSRVQSVTANFDHSFNEVWSTNVQARVSNTEFKELAQNFTSGFDFAGNSPALPVAYWNIMNMALYQQQKEVTLAASSLLKFNVGPTENKLLLGADYSRVTDTGYMYGDLNDIFTLGYVNLLNPAFPSFVEPGPGVNNANLIAGGDNTYLTAGGYAQLQTTAWERIHLLGGLRVANLQIENGSTTSRTLQNADASAILPRAGAVIDIVGGFSVFASYSQGLKGNPFTIYVGAPTPERSEQVEAGAKFDLGYGFTGSAAVFDINRTGVPVFTGVAYEGIGKQRSRGVETDLLWQPDSHWKVLANYSYINAILLNDIPGTAPAGSTLNIVPPHSGRLWVNYSFDGPLQGWSLGAGVYAASGAYVDLANLYRTNAYFTVDATLSYQKDNFAASVTVKNLTGEQYYVPYNYYGGRVATGDARGVYGKVSWKFK